MLAVGVVDDGEIEDVETMLVDGILVEGTKVERIVDVATVEVTDALVV